MTCRLADQLMSAYLDGEVAGSERTALSLHLLDCETCREEFEALKATKILLRSQVEVEVPEALEERLCEAVFAAPARDNARWMSWAAAVACFFLAMVATLGILNRTAADQQIADERSRQITFEIQRDQMTSGEAEPFSGTPIITAGYVPR